MPIRCNSESNLLEAVAEERAINKMTHRSQDDTQGLLSNTLGFRSTRSRGSLSGHSAAITSRTIGQRLPVPTWLAHTRSGMSEPEAVSVQPPMAGSHPGPGDSPRSNGSTFSPDGDRALLDVDLQNATVTSVPAIPDVTNIQLPAAAGEVQNGRLPAESGQMMQASFHRVIAHQKQIHDILFDASCKVPNTHRSQIIGLLRQIVQECADIRAIAENQGGRMDELRHQLALSRHSASLGAALSAPRPVQTAVTYAAAAARNTARPTVVPPVWPETCSHPVLPSHWSEIADQHTTHTTRREHEHIMFLTPLIPSTNPANEVTKIIKSNIDPMRENIGELTIRKTRHGLTILTNDHNAITRLKNALEKNAITSMSLSVRLPQKRKPRVKLTGVDSDIPAANIISQLNMRNPNLHLDPTTCRVAVSYKERSGNFTHVLEVDPSTCRSLLAQERVLLGWTACSDVASYSESPPYHNFCVSALDYSRSYANKVRSGKQAAQGSLLHRWLERQPDVPGYMTPGEEMGFDITQAAATILVNVYPSSRPLARIPLRCDLPGPSATAIGHDDGKPRSLAVLRNGGPIPPKPPLLRKTATPTRPRRRHCFQLRREGHQPFGSVCLSARDCFCAELIRRADETTVS
ncbi:hypothetical protein HPB51_013812 [Rhipicephalus microplus]|uniref:Uncharacterized protein n=1 Tax=Rhipicephalus microplus TaxID=6941 RepID=A0A9J6F4X5_RHIMP|nr:hypothetical protein HPB51_013812 [Rhipicephalus microplus]